jgi:3-phytase
MQRKSRRALCALPLFALLAGCSQAEAVDSENLSITHLSSMRVPDGLTPFDVPLGGFSGIDYDSESGAYLVISDDRAEDGPARAYTVKLTLDAAGKFVDSEPEVTGLTKLTDPDGKPYEVKGIDGESIRLAPGSDELVYSSEGDASKLLAPFIRRANAEGGFIRDYAVPEHFIPAADASGEQVSGIRNNLAFEGMAFSSDGAQLLALTEASLIQDGTIATAQNSTDSRLLVFDAKSGEAVDEFVYEVSKFTEDYPAFTQPDGYVLKADRGATEILALAKDEYLVVERGTVPGKGNEVQIFWTTTAGATSVSGKAKLDGSETPMPKRLLFDFTSTGANPDNVEGITWGPTLDDGTRTLVLVADDNFNPEGGQHTMFHVLAVR